MRAFVDAKAFKEALEHVCKLTHKSSIPALEGILVRFENDSCSLTATDITTWLTVKLPARGDTFSFGLRHPKTALSACRYFDGELTLETCASVSGEPKAVFSCGRRSVEFETFPAKDCPEFPALKKELFSFTANAAALLKRIERVKYAVLEPKGYSEKATSTCVQFCGNDVFCLDGYRAACDTDTALTFPRPFLTWGDSLAYLKLMGDSEMTVCADEWSIRFSTDTVSLSCRNEGVDTFNLMAAVPKSFLEEFYVFPKEFLRELDFMKKAVQSKRADCVRFCGGQMLMSGGKNRCCTEVQIEGRSELTIGFSLCYMEEALKQFKGEPSVKVKFSSSIGPIILEAEGRSDFAMVLPVRLRNAAAA